ncbi:hypothetical protein AMEX_G5507 [Astyanax mexicanus]|uniref:Uncharacterized protein n=1 Tax=Astyanax mexicanus TaxID=7994 RepID=A0A8T2MGG6_ASTMX|nr:hypothetical protein AMEX_G5507 [Astyanax mexicanus]
MLCLSKVSRWSSRAQRKLLVNTLPICVSVKMTFSADWTQTLTFASAALPSDPVPPSVTEPLCLPMQINGAGAAV